MEARRWKEEGTLQEAAARTVLAVEVDPEIDLPLLDMARVFKSRNYHDTYNHHFTSCTSP